MSMCCHITLPLVTFVMQEFDVLNTKYMAMSTERDELLAKVGALEQVKRSKTEVDTQLASVTRAKDMLVVEKAGLDARLIVSEVGKDEHMRKVIELTKENDDLSKKARMYELSFDGHRREIAELKREIEQLKALPKRSIEEIEKEKEVCLLFSCV